MRALPIVTLALSSILATACVAGPDDADEHTAEVSQRQIDGGWRSFRQVSFTFNDSSHTSFAVVTIVNRATPSYVPGTEYWFVNRSALGLLGSYALDVTVSDGTGTVDPPNPDYPNEQTFTQVEYPTAGWGSAWSTDPLSGGVLYDDGNGTGLRLFVSTTGNLSEIAWYQVIPSTHSPHYLTPSGRFTAGSTSMSVTSGYLGYDIDQAVP